MSETAVARPVDVNDESFDAEVMRSSMPVVLEFWSPQCMHCQKMSKVVESLAEELAGKVKVVKVNILENAVTPERFGVSGLPAFFLIKGGEVTAKTLGAIPRGRLKKDLGL
jgi:thioredoxin 1